MSEESAQFDKELSDDAREHQKDREERFAEPKRIPKLYRFNFDILKGMKKENQKCPYCGK